MKTPSSFLRELRSRTAQVHEITLTDSSCLIKLQLSQVQFIKAKIQLYFNNFLIILLLIATLNKHVLIYTMG